jgi:hypothetical protein
VFHKRQNFLTSELPKKDCYQWELLAVVLLVFLELYEFLSKIWCTEVLEFVFFSYMDGMYTCIVLCTLYDKLDLLMPIKFYLLISGLCVLFI